MNITILLTEELKKTMPKSIIIESNYGVVNVKVGKKFHSGEHVHLFGEEKIIKEWLKPFDVVLKSVGSPVEQLFEIIHIK